MNLIKINGYHVWVLLAAFLMTSCERVNLDEQEITEEEITVEIVEVEQTSINCESAMLSLQGGDLDFNKEAAARLFVGDACTFSYSDLNYNYMIHDVNWDFFGQDPEFITLSDGAPAISFGFDQMPEAGDVLQVAGYDPLFIKDGDSWDNVYRTVYANVTIESLGIEEGDEISGRVGGLFVGHNEPDTIAIQGSFCAPLVSICQ